MTRIVVGFAVLAGLLLALGIDVGELIFLVLVLLVVIGGFSLIILQRLPRHFIAMFSALALGPCLISSIIRGGVQSLLAQFGFAPNPSWNFPRWSGPVLLLFALGVSFVAYCIIEARRRRERAPTEVRGAERTPLVPQHLDGEEII